VDVNGGECPAGENCKMQVLCDTGDIALAGGYNLIDGHPRYHAFWAFDREGERRAFEQAVDLMAERLAQRPSAHVYHYNHYEPTALDHLAELHVTREDALRELMGRFATREDQLDNLLRRRMFVDLYRG
jgi:predicted RecB family nuclease